MMMVGSIMTENGGNWREWRGREGNPCYKGPEANVDSIKKSNIDSWPARNIVV